MNVEKLRASVMGSFWFVPTICVIAAVALAEALLAVDQTVSAEVRLAFTGGPSAAREILGTIASSTLTLTGLVFSITIVALQLTSSQFSPRVLRTFLQDRPTQLALGAFLAAYVYALFALRAVRGEDGGGSSFVPGITIAVGFALALLSVGMFVHYIHHIAQSLRAVSIIGRIGDETRDVLDRLYPQEPSAQPAPSRSRRPVRRIPAAAGGVVTSVEIAALVRLARDADVYLRLLVRNGDFVPANAALVEVSGDGDVDVDDEAVAKRITLERERDLRQDVAFGFRQLVDIAERALSPGINDPTTAVQCLDQLHDLLRRLGLRPFPNGVYADADGVARLQLPTTSWEEYVALALDEIRHWGASSLQIQRRIHELIADLLDVVDEERRPPLRQQRMLLDLRAESDLPAAERR